MARKISLYPPAIESLFDIGKNNYLWPKEIAGSQKLAKQIKLRDHLYNAVVKIFESISDSTVGINEALEIGLIEESDFVEFCELLINFLAADENHGRIILYLPNELLPNLKVFGNRRNLSIPAKKLANSYMKSWHKLLLKSEVRANFVDGDILEPELAPTGQKLVKKATHLIPWLLEKGFLSLDEIKHLLKNTNDPVLRDSLLEVLLFLENNEKVGDIHKQPLILEKLSEDLNFALKKIAMRSAINQLNSLPPARIAWEKIQKKENLISEYGDRLSILVMANPNIYDKEVVSLLKTPADIANLVVINGTRKAVLKLTDRKKCNSILQIFLATMRRFNTKDISFMRDELDEALAQWFVSGLLRQEDLDSFGFKFPDFEKSLDKKIEKDIKKLSGSVELILKNPEISQFLYPAAIFFGSRLKGYAKSKADLDMAVFIKPGVPKRKRPQIKSVLKKVFQDKKIDGKVVEFWLKEKRGRFSIRDFKDLDVFLADSNCVHLLFASVWLGEENEVKNLYAKLLSSFFTPEGRKIRGYAIREIWLREMEHEILLYRLLHKGYGRFFPRKGGLELEELDPGSYFWDSGYRRLATKLFIKKVFLPEL